MDSRSVLLFRSGRRRKQFKGERCPNTGDDYCASDNHGSVALRDGYEFIEWRCSAPPSVEIALSQGPSGVLGGLTPLASVSWSGSTITLRKALVPMTGQYVLPIRGEIGDLVGISETASQFVF